MTPQEISKELDEVESRLERLRIKYEQYFAGYEKMVPFVQRKDVDRRFAALHKEQFRNAGLRFRFNTLVQRFTTYQTHWGRTLRRIEEGTFKRDVLKAKKLREALIARDAQAQEPALLEAGSFGETAGEREEIPARAEVKPTTSESVSSPALTLDGLAPRSPQTVQRPPSALRGATPPPVQSPVQSPVQRQSTVAPVVPAQAPTGLLRKPPSVPNTPAEDPKVRELWQRFVDARKQTGESVDVRYESIARQVRDTLPKLSERYKGADVKFDVAIKDGKAVLRPVVTVKKK